MRLKNKKTGEMGYLRSMNWNETALIIMDKNGVQLAKYNSLAELNEEWKDYEEPKEYWFIDEYGMIQQEIDYYYNENKSAVHDKRLEVGNYFGTQEEAEKAVEKLKAWKRLKDKGFKFEGWDNTDHSTIHNFSLFVVIEDLESINKDLDLLFGGEE